MKVITLSDAGRRVELIVRNDIDAPNLPTTTRPPHQQFVEWWREQAQTRGIPYSYGTAEPQGYVIVSRLLKRHSLENLKRLGVACMLSYGEELREYAGHFALFASKLDDLAKRHADELE